MRRTFEKKKSEKAKKNTVPMDAALRYLTNASRTKREMERHLDGENFDEVAVYETVARLEELGYINDLAYAGDFIATRLSAKAVSRAHIRQQLVQHEVEESAMEQALAEISDETEDANALQIAQKYDRQLSALPDEERYERVLQRILTRGFGFETARRAMTNLVHQEKSDD